MDAVLIFPPGWEPFQPYLSVPALKAFLHEEGFVARGLDVNLQFHEYLLSGKFIREAARLVRIENPENHILSHEEMLLGQLTASLSVLRSSEFYHAGTRQRALRTIALAWLLAEQAFPDMEVSFRCLAVSGNQLNDGLIADIIDNRLRLPFFRWYEDAIAPQLTAMRPRLIGVSVVCYDQIVPSLVLAVVIRRHLPKCRIVFGGDAATRLRFSILRHSCAGRFVDYVVSNDGEEALARLLDCILRNDESESTLRKLGNLTYKRLDGTVVATPASGRRKLDSLPTADFSDFPLDRYFSPEPALPVETSRGCYWSKCSFCEEVGKPYNLKTPSRVADEIEYLSRKHEVRLFTIVDSCVPPRMIKGLSIQLTSRRLDVFWRALIRMETSFDIELARLAFKGGCRMIMTGIETGSDSVSELIKKGIRNNQASSTLENFANCGIWNHCFFMVGLPSESLEDFQKTVDFIACNSSIIDSVAFSAFVACKGTPLFEELPLLGVVLEEDLLNDWQLHFTDFSGNIMNYDDRKTALRMIEESLDVLKTDIRQWKELHINQLFAILCHTGKASRMKNLGTEMSYDLRCK